MSVHDELWAAFAAESDARHRFGCQLRMAHGIDKQATQAAQLLSRLRLHLVKTSALPPQM